MISYAVPEIRRLLISLVQRYAPDPAASGLGPAGDDDAQYQARLCHYRQRGYALTLSADGVLAGYG